MTTASRTFALIPAAGKSSRMGRPKLALPLGERSILEHVITAIRAAGIETTLVVLAPHSRELLKLARAAGAEVLLLPEETPDMRATVEKGLAWFDAKYHPTDADDWMLALADHPLLDPAVIKQLLAARGALPEASILVPTHDNRRGHPVLIGWQHVRQMRELPARQGLNVYLRQHAADTLEVPVSTQDILCDLDTPDDYERLLRS